MSEADMQMVRGQAPGEHNLAIGEPFFLQEAFTSKGIYPPVGVSFDPTYPLLGGDPELVASLREEYGGKHVVVTTGAKQALVAGAYAIQQQNPGRVRTIAHLAPHWPSYPTIADLSKLRFDSAPIEVFSVSDKTIRVVSAPNNPDGMFAPDHPNGVQWDIWDAAYASEEYGWNKIVPYSKISVWSAAKRYGMSGARVGWLVTADPALAQAAARYVEMSTSGVANSSQAMVLAVRKTLKALSPIDRDLLYGRARNTLLTTSLTFVEYFGNDLQIIDGYPRHGHGMFAWVLPKDYYDFLDKLKRARILVVDGRHCGVPGWVRISLGVLPGAMVAAGQAFQEA